ncbi:MAG: hypothetical protein MUF64_26815, partial [Polyangiaceae bacterium]|nr:hypothetical protein [Polyangiaceae bacterium]
MLPHPLPAPPEPPHKPVPLDIDTNGGLDALRVVLQDALAFSLILLEVPVGPARQEILARLQAWSGKDGIPPLHFVHLLVAQPPLQAMQALNLARPRTEGVVLTGLEQYEVGGQISPSLGQLNLARDILPTLVPGPLLLVADGAFLEAIARTLPDFYSWREFSLAIRAAEITPPGVQVEQIRLPAPEEASGELERTQQLVDKALERYPKHHREVILLRLRLAEQLLNVFRSEDAHQLLVQLEAPLLKLQEPATTARFRWLSGLAMFRRSEHEVARQQYEAALPLYRRVGDVLGEANCIR